MDKQFDPYEIQELALRYEERASQLRAMAVSIEALINILRFVAFVGLFSESLSEKFQGEIKPGFLSLAQKSEEISSELRELLRGFQTAE